MLNNTASQIEHRNEKTIDSTKNSINKSIEALAPGVAGGEEALLQLKNQRFPDGGKLFRTTTKVSRFRVPNCALITLFHSTIRIETYPADSQQIDAIALTFAGGSTSSQS